MKYKSYSPQLWERIRSSTQSSIQEFGAQKLIAAFDADGTLWDTDFGENFFQFQIDRKLVEMPANPWQYYWDLKGESGDPRPGFLWLAQICQGHSLAEVKKWADESFASQGSDVIFQEQQKVIRYFLDAGITVAIVTASVAWAIEPGARKLGVPTQNVIGVRTEVRNGIVTDIQQGPVTYREGKVAGLKQYFPNHHCFFASGNTTGDLELLTYSKGIRLAVTATVPGNRVHESEMELQRHAHQHGWEQHSFI